MRIFLNDAHIEIAWNGLGRFPAKWQRAVANLDGDGDMDILDKPYNWETPRVDVWLQHGTGR